MRDKLTEKNRPQTVNDLLQWAVLFLGKEKRLEIEVLLAQVAGLSRASLLAYPEKILNREQVEKFRKKVCLRKENIPLQYLTGKQNFMGMDFQVNENVLIPRSDTEVLVEEVITLARNLKGQLTILDLCTGSGAIAISLAKYLPQAQLVATDISPEALEVAKINAQVHGVAEKITFKEGDLFEPLGQIKFHIITANPPYISTPEMEELPRDVKKEPRLALWGGEDGLYFYRKITALASDYLKSSGYLFMEIGYRQGQAVRELCLTSGFRECVVVKDWAGQDRVVKAQTQP